jgi:hypothetical protein
MYTKNITVLSAIAVLMLMTASASHADSFPFVASGTNGASGDVSASALFTISGSTLTIVLQNTHEVSDIGQSLTGIEFTLSGTSSGPPATSLSLTTVSASAFLDCVGVDTGDPCKSVGSFYDYKAGATIGSPFTWELTDINIADYQLFAGGTAWHPAGILPVGTVAADGLGTNDPHNDWLGGPVTYTIAVTGALTDIDSVNFYFGTSGFNIPGTVPEPTSLALLGLGIACLGLSALRRKNKL